MSDLIVITYHTAEEARAARGRALELKKRGVLALDDAAIATRDPDGDIHIRQLHSVVWIGAAVGAVWGALIGLLFRNPLIGVGAGALAGAVGGRLTDIGVNDEFMRRVATSVEPGHSALFLLGTSRNTGRLLASVAGENGAIIHTTLTPAQEQVLVRAWGRRRVHRAEHAGDAGGSDAS